MMTNDKKIKNKHHIQLKLYIYAKVSDSKTGAHENIFWPTFKYAMRLIGLWRQQCHL